MRAKLAAFPTGIPHMRFFYVFPLEIYLIARFFVIYGQNCE